MTQPDDSLGLCGRVVDREQELICPNPAEGEVFVRNKFGVMVVRLCGPCLTLHARFYRRLNLRRGRVASNKTKTANPGE